jgi:hypothetical protein
LGGEESGAVKSRLRGSRCPSLSLTFPRPPSPFPLPHPPFPSAPFLNAPPFPDELGGDLSKVKRIVKITCFVNAVENSTNQPQVANGASDLFGAVFGEAGRHARSAVGVASLPLAVPVEIEAIVEVSE